MFLRLGYEVDINKEILILDAKFDEEVQSKNKKWVPYNKGREISQNGMETMIVLLIGKTQDLK